MSILDDLTNNEKAFTKKSMEKWDKKAKNKSGKHNDETPTLGNPSEEFAEEWVSDVSQFGIQSYATSGVIFEKLNDKEAKINYSGLLAKSGATQVIGVLGYGSNQSWEDVRDIYLSCQGSTGFESVIPIVPGKNVNLAFKDPAENWDNNSGLNYTFVN